MGKARKPQVTVEGKRKAAHVKPAAAQPSTVPAVIALEPAGHDGNAQSSSAHEGNEHDWPVTAPGHYASEDGDGGWGEGAGASEEMWGEPSAPAAEDDSADAYDSGGGWGAPTGGGWGAPTGGGWGAAPVASGGWGDPPAPANNGQGVFGVGRGNAKKGSAHHSTQSPATGAQAPLPASLHPSAAAAPMSTSHGWGAPAPAPAPAGWGEPPRRVSWGQPAAPRPPAAKPAWANWANEAKMGQVNTPYNPPANPYAHVTENAASGGGTRQVLSDQQRSQIMSSLLEAPVQQSKGYFSQPHTQQNRQRHQSAPHANRPPQAFHPSQQQHGYLEAQLVAEQQSILRSLQDHNPRIGRAQPQQARGHPVQYADSWTHWGREGWGGDRASTIPEEDEDYDDDEDYEDEEDDGWGPQDYGTGQRVRFSPNVDYARSARSTSSAARSYAHGPAPAPGTSPPRHAYQQVWTPSQVSSRTMKMATGTLTSPVTVKTTIFELAPPRNGVGENTFIESHGEAIKPAERALFYRDRPAKERFRWGFNPDKDPRVGSLLQWVAAMSSGLATIGLQRFLETRERGALFANADFRVPALSGHPPQPAFDWLTLSQIQNTLDSTLQSSVTLYDPAFQVIVFVFLLSPSGNSMAVWRRKLNVPDGLRNTNQHEILAVKAELKRHYPVYVDELPVKPEEATPNVKKKKVRFAFFRRMFGGGKKVQT